MGILPKNIFSKQTAQPAVEEVPLQEKKIKNLVKKLKTESPKTLLRGPDGKFISKKESPSRLQTAAINNVQIRHFKADGQWFFCIEDIIASAGVIDVVDYIKTLKEKEDLRKVWAKTAEVESEKEEKNILLEFATAEDIKAISGQFDNPIPDPVWKFLNKTASS